MASLGHKTSQIGNVRNLLGTHISAGSRSLERSLQFICRCHYWKTFLLLGGSCKAVVNMIASQRIFTLADRHHIDTFSRLQFQLPVVVGHSGDNMVMGERPSGSDTTVFHPQMMVLFGECGVPFGVLDKDRGMWLPTVVHDFPLVVHQVLDGKGRGNHLPARPEMIELTRG